MKNVLLNSKLVRSVVLASSLVMSAFSAQADLVLSFDQSDIEVSLNETFTLDLYVETETTVDSILSWGLDLDFDSLEIAFNSFTLGSDFVALPISDDGIGGASALPTGVFGSNVLLGTFELTALDYGTFSVSTSNSFGDLFEGFTTLNFFSPVVFNSASANVSVVSAPATVGLFGLTLIALAGLRRKA